MNSAGQILAGLRQKLGLTLGDVVTGSTKIAQKYANNDFLIPRSLVEDIEKKGAIPSAHQMYSLSVIYRTDIRRLLSWYGVKLEQFAADLNVVDPATTHLVNGLDSAISLEVPLEMDAGFDPTRSVDIARMIAKWGPAPFAYLQRFNQTECAYSYVGTDDWTMYPLIPPGSFLQIDKKKNKVAAGPWRNVPERPIYFVETRDGYRCCWCSLDGDNIVLHPHPVSGQAARVLRHPQDAAVIGQVIGAAIRFDCAPSGR